MVVVYCPGDAIKKEKTLSFDFSSLEQPTVTLLRLFPLLHHALAKKRNQIKILVILISNPSELTPLEQLREYLVDLKTIFVLPNDDADTFTLASSFFPNYVSYLGTDFSDVRAVVEKMLDQ